MGIIISSFIGCGREYLKNTHGDKAKIFDAVEEITLTENTQDALENYYNRVMDIIGDYDIVFIGTLSSIRDIFNIHKVDYDIFYPSVGRRGEFIENQVRKRTKPDVIRMLDKNFEKWVNEIDEDESPNCYKHKLSKQGEYIGNEPSIIQYINSLKS